LVTKLTIAHSPALFIAKRIARMTRRLPHFERAGHPRLASQEHPEGIAEREGSTSMSHGLRRRFRVAAH
jgi:hypothetical protein